MLCGSEDIDATLRNLVPLSLHDYQAGDPSPQDCCKTRRHEVQEHAHQVRGLLRWFNPPNVSNGSNFDYSGKYPYVSYHQQRTCPCLG